MTLQELLAPAARNSHSYKEQAEQAQSQLQEKTAQLLAANKAAAAVLLNAALAKLEQSAPTSQTVEKRIWI
jgi:hypothetical protein